MMRSFLILFLSVFIVISVSAQERLSLVGQSLHTLKHLNQLEQKARLFAIPSIQIHKSPEASTDKQQAFRSLSVPIIYSYEELAPFCKLEVKMEKVVKMPIKFRLGSVDYVDYLEGKRDWY